MGEVIFGEDYKKKLSKLKSDGADNLHIVSDFDRTITKFKTKDGKANSSFQKLKDSGFMPQEFIEEADRLYSYYRPIEISGKIPPKEKFSLMKEWFEKYFSMALNYNLNKEMLEEIFSDDALFRDAIDLFFELVDSNDLSLLIFSAGLGDAIEIVLERRRYLKDNIHIISNFYTFDEKGKAVGYIKPLIHSHNKNEFEVKHEPYLKQIEERRNLILMGDALGDLGMSAGLYHDCVLKIGFLNDNVERLRRAFVEKFDVVIVGSNSISKVNEILEKILF